PREHSGARPSPTPGRLHDLPVLVALCRAARIHRGDLVATRAASGFALSRRPAGPASEGNRVSIRAAGPMTSSLDAASDDSPLAVLARLNAAMNRHDLEAFVACFDPGYESEQPAHPDRRFRGAAQVARNWAAMFAGVPDFRAEIEHSVVEGEAAWVEWRWTGTRADGSRLDARGV